MTTTQEPTTRSKGKTARTTQVDISEELTRRLNELPDKGLAQVKEHLQLNGHGSMAEEAALIASIEVLKAGVKVSLENFQYDDVMTHVNPPRSVTEQTILNDSDAEIRQSFTYSWAEERSFEYSFSEGLKVGTEVTASVGTPETGGMSAKITAEMQFTAEQRWTYKKTIQQQNQQVITVPPRTSLCVSATLTAGTSTARFRGDAVATEAMVRASVKGRHPKDFDVFGILIVDLPLTALLADDRSRTVPVAGTMQGAQTVNVFVRAVPAGDVIGSAA